MKDSRHFISLIKNITLSDADILVSFDVESLFIKVPIPETMKIIQDLFEVDLTDLAELCLKSTFFYFNGKYYEQPEGAAMESPLSPVAANLYMESFEKEAIQTAELKPSLWYRYVDDVWAVWPHGRHNLDNFLDHINAIHQNITFTMEIEKDRCLPFLDVLMKRKSNGRIGHAAYRKNTHTNRYLNTASHHHLCKRVLYEIFN